MKSEQLIIFIFALIFVLASMGCNDPKEECDNISCQNGGICIDGVCDCPSGYSGDNCEIYDPCYNVFCENGGSCENGLCICPWGYYGSNCQYQKIPKSMIINKIDIIYFPFYNQNGNSWDSYNAQSPLQWCPDIYIEVNSSIYKVFESGVIENCVPGTKYTIGVNSIINGAYTLCSIDLFDHDSGGGSNNDFMCSYKFYPTEYVLGFPKKFRLYNQSSWHQLILDIYVDWIL